MTVSPSRTLAGAGAALAVLASVLIPATPAAAHGHCEGVTVVVDFGSVATGADTEPAIGCAQAPADGLDALIGAGFDITEVASFPGMVCRIDDLPETDCAVAPPAGASWAYWRASASDTKWTFSSVGAAQAEPGEGDLEGWVFGDGTAPPSISPRQAAAADADHVSDEDEGGSPTWLIAVVVLAGIAGLVIWRLRAGKHT
ncbi:hypothetical protein [Glycomyces buryatensis]|uniref:Uncharacterized protein n=1 Tax=Glycomyces buryatensis TaxID=2570927 RepID=A0A4S8QBE0_9ACTN|nr:hypothetical protein [Glycomyces buryatensis]THV41590.1 hypothetical protein FAB82_10835 [Glycomyces buryatensis]